MAPDSTGDTPSPTKRPTQRPSQRPTRRPTQRPTTRRPARGALGLARALLVPLLLVAVLTAATPGWSSYTIRRGENLESIAKRYHTTVATLVQVNRLAGNGNLIYAGESLRVPVPHVVSRTVLRSHRVVSGDSLIRIARHYGVRTAAIARVNHLPRSNVVRLGEVIRVPVTQRRVTIQGTTGRSPTSSGNTFAGRTYASAVVSTASRNRAALARRYVPGPTQMRSLIVSSARRNGVDPSLALAVSWQEAGWNMRRVSVANAIGAMQVVPATGVWISGVIGRRLDLLNPLDNVTAGVILLKILSRSAASDEHAIAGYYQGLKSVRERGMFADTKHYVANVQYLQRRFAQP